MLPTCMSREAFPMFASTLVCSIASESDRYAPQECTFIYYICWEFRVRAVAVAVDRLANQIIINLQHAKMDLWLKCAHWRMLHHTLDLEWQWLSARIYLLMETNWSAFLEIYCTIYTLYNIWMAHGYGSFQLPCNLYVPSYVQQYQLQ